MSAPSGAPPPLLGEGVVVGEGATVERSVVLAGSEIGAGSVVHDSILAARVSVGTHCRIGDATIGEGVRIGADNVIARGARLFPGLELPDGAIKF